MGSRGDARHTRLARGWINMKLIPL